MGGGDGGGGGGDVGCEAGWAGGGKGVWYVAVGYGRRVGGGGYDNGRRGGWQEAGRGWRVGGWAGRAAGMERGAVCGSAEAAVLWQRVADRQRRLQQRVEERPA